MRDKSKPARFLALLLPLLGACEAAEPPRFGFEVVGRLEDKNIDEASGLARSQRQENQLWLINDSGAKEYIHAIDSTGERLGEFDLKKSRNVDWEDLASFRYEDKPYLMVADIGDNEARRDFCTLYFVKEPKASKNDDEKLDWRVDFAYPDGPRDAEAAAIDIDNERVLILSKRYIPPVLYEVPLQANSNDIVDAKRLGKIVSLLRPSKRDIDFAPKSKDWHWQPVGMDISDDNLAAVILTYRFAYYYQRQPGRDWYDALNSRPARVSLGNFRNAESIAFGDDKRTVFVTGENKNSRLLRIDFDAVERR